MRRRNWQLRRAAFDRRPCRSVGLTTRPLLRLRRQRRRRCAAVRNSPRTTHRPRQRSELDRPAVTPTQPGLREPTREHALGRAGADRVVEHGDVGADFRLKSNPIGAVSARVYRGQRLPQFRAERLPELVNRMRFSGGHAELRSPETWRVAPPANPELIGKKSISQNPNLRCDVRPTPATPRRPPSASWRSPCSAPRRPTRNNAARPQTPRPRGRRSTPGSTTSSAGRGCWRLCQCEAR